MYKLDMIQSIYGRIDEFGWWDLQKNSADSGTKFISMEFQDKCQTHGVHLALAAQEHQEMN